MSDKKTIPPPMKPSPHECCGSGCTPCVFDYYYAALEKWQEDVEALDEKQNDEEESQ